MDAFESAILDIVEDARRLDAVDSEELATDIARRDRPEFRQLLCETLAERASTDLLAENARLTAQRDALAEALRAIVVDEERRAKDLRHREAWLPLKFSEERMANARAALATLEETDNG